MPYEFNSLLAEDIVAYLALRASLGYSTDLYARQLHDIDDFCAKGFPEEETLTKAMVMKWIELRETECAGTQHIRASVIRMFGRFQSSEGKDAYILADRITPPITRYAPYILTDIELAALFNAIDTMSHPSLSPELAYLLPVVFRMMYCCGLRPGEPLRLRRGDVNLDSGLLTVYDTKNHTNRLVVMSDDLTGLCRRYDAYAGAREHFFVRPSGEPLTTAWLNYRFKACLRQAGLGELPIRQYELRHRFATAILMDWVDRGLDVLSLMPRLAQYMGHKKTESTFYYIHLLGERLVHSAGIDWEGFSDLYPKGLS